MTQELLEKFEFFPIKCRIQRAMEVLRIESERKGAKAGSPFKIKASENTIGQGG